MAKANTDRGQDEGKNLFFLRCASSSCEEVFDFSFNPRLQNKPLNKKYCPYCGSAVDARDKSCSVCRGKLTVVDPTIVKFCISCGSYLESVGIPG